MPKYIEIAQAIERSIKEQDLLQGTRLANITTLTKEYDVSKNTILKTLQLLEERGVIYQVQGSGIFVRRKKRRGYISLIQNRGFTDDLKAADETSRVITLETIAATKEIATNLQCDVGDPIYFVERVHSIRGQVFCFEQSYYKQDIVPFLNRAIAEDSIFDYLEKGLNLQIGFSDKYLKVARVKEDIAHFLELNVKDPVLFIEELYYTAAGKPFDFSKNYYHPDYSQFFIQS
ncbi:GntR family transcriptional regulator [uncultured Enterococcus sp.]|uniref:GntR family transcriptional regulator n=1 Tax=uncultured Enterococcus sp. TaxID=167972 RepID=UPI0025EED6C2|nr:GntR family transcriptional regulator [uncultured Enterococcus sp.]